MSDPRIAVVTEATTALGEAISLALARAGYSVLGSGRRHRVGEVVMRKIRDQGGQAGFLVTDPDSEDAAAAFVAETAARYGRLDVAVNNVGVAVDEGRLSDVRTDAVERMFRLNLAWPWSTSAPTTSTAPCDISSGRWNSTSNSAIWPARPSCITGSAARTNASAATRTSPFRSIWR
jgi:NAD(P)-dependent dehydrogenase (short-subunit alcohol dehydrogenase family)